MALPVGRLWTRGLLAALVVVGSAAAARPVDRTMFQIRDGELEPLSWSELDGWTNDDHGAAFAGFQVSCRALVSRRAEQEPRMLRALGSVCRRALAAGKLESESARVFFEDNFRPARVSRLGEPLGFLTGYYEPIVEGSRFPTREFTVPLYRRPADLVAPGARRNHEFPNKGKVGRRIPKRGIVPYYDRAEIEAGALDGRHLEICWLKDPIDAFFIHIQGSARVRLEDGELLRLNYDAHNGHHYTPVGRILIERNIVPKEEMSLDRIREWMLAHPEEGAELRRQNRSFVFFRVTGLGAEQEAHGAAGVSLMAGRSIAVDKALHVYGTPFFIEADLPIESSVPATRFRRLMIAQDTGSAIVGPARADIYFGAGQDAGHIAGRIRHPGRFIMLIPREIDPAIAGLRMPAPRPRPQPEAKAETSAATAMETVPPTGDGEAIPTPRPRPKITHMPRPRSKRWRS
jgi:membrane-bound lytic murein transglycosylase A